MRVQVTLSQSLAAVGQDCSRVGTLVACGCAVRQAVSRRLPTAVSQVQARVKLCGICGGHSGFGAEFSGYFGFPCRSFIPSIVLQTLSVIIRFCTIGQYVA